MTIQAAFQGLNSFLSSIKNDGAHQANLQREVADAQRKLTELQTAHGKLEAARDGLKADIDRLTGELGKEKKRRRKQLLTAFAAGFGAGFLIMWLIANATT